MTSEPQFRAERIAWMFKKSGVEGEFTKLFESLPEGTRDRLREQATVRPSEVPALAYVGSAGDWVLVTNERIVWRAGTVMGDLGFSDLADATVDPRDLLAARGKSSVATLTLRTVSGEAHKLALEAGPPFSGMWNALKMMAGRGPPS